MTDRSRKDGGLTPEDAEMWSHVTDTVHPMRRTHRSNVRGVASSETTGSDHALSAGGATPPYAVLTERMPHLMRIASTSTGKSRWQPLITTPTPRPTPPPDATQHFDRRRARKIATGKVEIEGRLDLHGLRESEAHVRLRGFLRQAQAHGKRTVLVITGKGRDEDQRFDFYDPAPESAPRGVLRRNVPRWLMEPDLAPLVVSFTTAHSRHGGEGALYVHLRRGAG